MTLFLFPQKKIEEHNFAVETKRRYRLRCEIALVLFTDLSFEAKFIWPPHENSSDEISKLKLTAASASRESDGNEKF